MLQPPTFILCSRKFSYVVHALSILSRNSKKLVWPTEPKVRLCELFWNCCNNTTFGMVGLTTKNWDHQNKQFFADHCNNFIHSFMIFIAKLFLEKNVAVSAVVCMGLEAVLSWDLFMERRVLKILHKPMTRFHDNPSPRMENRFVERWSTQGATLGTASLEAYFLCCLATLQQTGSLLKQCKQLMELLSQLPREENS